MKTFKTFALACSALACAGSFNSCSNEENYKYDPNYELEVAEASYANNFKKLIGEYENVESWDFSKHKAMLGTRAGQGITVEQVAGLDFKISNAHSYKNLKLVLSSTFGQNKALYDNISKALPDGQKQEGEPAVLAAPANSFMIYPVSAQGLYTYKAWVKVGDEEPVEIFTKNWNTFDKPYCNGMAYAYSNSKYSTANMPGVYIEAPVGTPIQVYLTDIKNGSNSVTDMKLGTGTGNAIVVDADVRPEGLGEDIMPENAVIKYIGMEDNVLTASGCDRDYNDLVFAIVGNPYVPEPIVITEDEFTVNTNIAKRYMVEDLGTTDDFDFNDVVLDVIENKAVTYKVTKSNGVITKTEITKTETDQRAIVRAMGGTLDFTITIGDTKWTKSENGFYTTTMYNTYNPTFGAELATIQLNDGDWDPDTNNIVVTVKNLRADGREGTYDITFAERGNAPLMIATDLDKDWMEERVRINWLSGAIK